MKRPVIALGLLALMLSVAGCGSPASDPHGTVYTLTIVTQGQGSVSPASGSQFVVGVVAELTPTPEEGWRFDHWGGPDGSQVVDNRIVMNGNKSITAVFVAVQPIGYTVSGRVVDIHGQGVENAAVQFSDGFGAVLTDSDGRWSTSGLSGTVTVTPDTSTRDIVVREYVWDPPSRTVSAATNGVDFVGTRAAAVSTVRGQWWNRTRQVDSNWFISYRWSVTLRNDGDVPGTVDLTVCGATNETPDTYEDIWTDTVEVPGDGAEHTYTVERLDYLVFFRFNGWAKFRAGLDNPSPLVELTYEGTF